MENKNYAIPLALAVIGVIIGGYFLLSGGSANRLTGLSGIATDQAKPSEPLDNFRPVDANDWIKGDLEADVIIVEYSDIECPFCKIFHETLKEVTADYDGTEVAWVFRHFPLDMLHQNARLEAEATQCAGLIGGNEKFWEYLSLLFETTTSNDGLDIDQLPEMAKAIGLDQTDFNNCLNQGLASEAINIDLQNAADSGAAGTPFAVIICKDDFKISIPGAIPTQEMKNLIDNLLTEEL
jgi:protein-disulfide isomerase